MMGDVSCSDLVVQEINDPPGIELVIRPINRVQGALDKIVVVIRKMRHVSVRVLQPVVAKQSKEYVGVSDQGNSVCLYQAMSDAPCVEN